MIITRLRGGLGNQMFQYAYGKMLAQQTGQRLKLDKSWFYSPGAVNPRRDYNLGIFTMKPAFASWLDKILVRRFKAGIYADGFWQEARHIEAVADSLRQDFRFASPILPTSSTLLSDIASSLSVCINVRRTDFVGDGKCVDTSYYEEASRLICTRHPGARFFVFSDDVAWCRNNLAHLGELPGAGGIVWVEHAHAGAGYGNYLQLMIHCKHFIIPSSTFGWWAAWLSDNATKTVIVPKAWPQGPAKPQPEIIPDGWVQI